MEKALDSNKTYFPTLYKADQSGAIRIWNIWTVGATIVTEHGQSGGKFQITEDTIKEGKNVGKKNATTPEQQAVAEAKAKHEKQLKKGYVTTLEAAKAGEVDEVVEGGILPMLAFTFEKQGKKIKYPCFVQKKYDGIRMIAVVKDGKCTLWSRTRKQITSLPHIVAEIEENFTGDVILDGEAYNHRFKTNFEHIVHLVRQEEPDKDCTDVEYHVYDVVTPDIFETRFSYLVEDFDILDFTYLKLADTYKVNSEEEVPEFFEKFRADGYEGAMLRNLEGKYVGKRSTDLIKVKEMQDAEFLITGIEEGRGKLAGHVGAFNCITGAGLAFKAKMSGDTSKLKEYFENHDLWKNKLLTVKFQDLTSYGIPRFPVGLRIREDV